MGTDTVKALRLHADELDYSAEPDDKYKRWLIKLLTNAADEIEEARNTIRGIPQGGFNPEEKQ